MQKKIFPILTYIASAYLVMNPNPALADDYWQNLDDFDSTDFTPGTTLKYVQTKPGKDQLSIKENDCCLQSPLTFLGLGAPNNVSFSGKPLDTSLFGAKYDLTLKSYNELSVDSKPALYDPRYYMSAYEQQVISRSMVMGGDGVYNFSEQIDKPWGSGAMPGPSVALINVVSAGTHGYYKDVDFPVTYAAGPGGDISLVADLALTYANSNVASRSGGLPWQPSAALVYASSQAGGATGDVYAGADGGSVYLNVSNKLSLNSVWGVGPNSISTAVSVSSIGSAGTAQGLPNKRDNNFRISQFHDIVEVTKNIGARTTETVCGHSNCNNLYFYADYDNTQINGSGKSAISKIHPNGNGGDVIVEGHQLSISGYVFYGIGVSASSVGGGHIFTGAAATLGGDFKYGVLYRDDKTPYMYYPGNSGKVNVTLSNSHIDLNGLSLVGISAISTSMASGLPINFRNYIASSAKSGDVTVSIDSASTITLSQNDWAANRYPDNTMFNAGVLAISARSPVPIFGDSFSINDVEIVPAAGVGDSGRVFVENHGVVSVSATQAVGLVALSTTGTGGVSAAGSNTAAGTAFKGGTPGEVSVTNSGQLTVSGEHVVAVMAASNGSGGLIHSLPRMKDSTVMSSFVGGSIGAMEILTWEINDHLQNGGRFVSTFNENPEHQGGAVSFINETGASIQSGNVDGTSKVAYGVLAQSIGSAGGLFMGGAAKHLGDAEKGKSGGAGGNITITNSGSIKAFGQSSVGILAQSIGGGGGAAANSDSWFVAIGGRGGNGGNGGSINLNFEQGSSVVTIGDYATGVIAHSIGGGGGHGGAAKSWGLFVDTAIGGAGGKGGHGGNIGIASQGKTFWTAGQHAHGMVLQSIGGGGGVGGSANSVSVGLVFSVAVALGGTGGDGGNGGTLQGSQDGSSGKTTPVHSHIVTNAHDSIGIVLQSIGGGGGLGGAAKAKSVAIGLGTLFPEAAVVPSIAVSFSLGGTGGGGGHGGAIDYWHVGNLSTYGDGSHGVLAHSIGGGGGTGGDSTAASSTLGAADTQINLSMGLGGSAANGGDGGDVWMKLGTSDGSVPTAIRTVGNNSMAAVAQSIGGGGGSAGIGSGFNLSVQFTPKAEDDTSENDDTLGQAGDDGDVGNMDDFKDLPDANNPKAVVNDASSTAGEADSDVANLDDLSDLDTSGVAVTSQEKSLFADAVTCLKKMLKTSSVLAGLGDCDEESPSAPSPTTVTLSIDVGKKGGGGGHGGSVTLTSNASIFTSGSGSTAILAQSVGGGGGHGASAGAHASGGQVNATVNVGGSGGTGGNGGSVTVENDGLIVTGQMYDLANPLQQDLTKFVAPAVTGGESHGIHAQSIGGGGGVGGNADPHSSAVSSIIADLINGKYETAGLYALGLSTADINDIEAGVSILKWGLLGSAPTNFSFSPTVNVGGTGGSGGNAGTVVTSNQGLIRTFGHRSYGVLAHSIGGGGGVAGSVNGALIDLSGSETMNGINFNPSINVGGAGGVAGDGGDVSFTSGNRGLIRTHGYASYGIALQSIGGGGGIAHEGSTFGISDTVGLDSDVSVTGGLTFGGGRSSASYDAQAHSANASGSIGFGSGNVKKGDDVIVNYGNSGRSGNVTLGTASAPAKGSVVTHGDDAMAIFAQTVSGGGGLATLGCSNSSASSGSHYASACWGNPNVQGSAGQVGAFVGGGGTSGVQVNLNSHSDKVQRVSGGQTGIVNIYTEQHITTYGARSMGLVAQNITGGGGFFSSANSRIHSVNMPTQQRVTNPTGDGTTAVNIQLTGSTITTYGDGAWGLLSQSAVGGGGFFGDASKDLAFNVKYDQNNAAASDVFAAGNRPLSITEVKFGRHQVSDTPFWYGPCGQSNTCKVSLTPGENYKMPYQNGKVSWDVGDYLQLSKSDDAGYPYTVTQFKEDGSLKESLGNGRIELMQDGAFIFTASGPTGTMFRGDGLITGDQYTVHGIYQPTVAKIDEFAAANFYTVPLDVVGGSVSKFSRPQVAAAHFWNTTACRDTNTCSIGQVVGGQPDLIPYSSGQVAWEEGDYIQIRASTDLDHPYLLEQYASDGTFKNTVGTGKILNLGEQYFFVAGSDTTYPQGGGDGTGFVFGASAVTATSLSLTGIINPTLAQVNEYLRVHYAAMPAVKSVVNSSHLAKSATVDEWATGATKVQLTDSHVRTYGTNAHGMVIQNLGSVGGAWSSRGEKLTMGVSLVGENVKGNTPGGKVDLTLSNSSVAVYGPRSRGVVIQTDGAGPGGAYDQAQIKVALSNGSSIFSEQHTALMLVGGSYKSKIADSDRNTVTIDGSSSITSGLYQQYQGFALDDTDATYNKWAVYAPTGYTNLTNDGTITGNILLGIVTKGDFVNNGTWQGSTAVAATNSLHNYGTIYAGGDGTVGGLHIEGALKHYEGGEIHLDVHPAGAGASHDVITVTGLARIEGEIVPQTKSLLPGNYQFLTAGTLEHSGSVRDAHVFSWDATVNGNTLIKTPTANFAPAGFGLSGNQASLAGYLQRGWDSSEREKAALFGYLHEHEFGAHGDYQATLDQLMGQTLNVQPIQFQTAFSTYLGDSLSCPTVTQQGLKLNQDNCAWAKVTGDITEQSSNSANPGYHATGGGIRVGAQRSVGEGWTAGFGAGYGLNYLKSSNFSSNGQFFDLSLSVKKQIEQWTFGASLGFAQGWFDNNRSLAMVANGAADPMSALFSSKSRMTMAGLRWRAAFEHAIDEDQYLKPYVDVDLVYGYTPGYSETGAGKLGLNVGSYSRWNVAITPMLEYGLDVVTEDKSRVKLFVSAGASFLPNNTHKNQVSFQGVSSGLGTFDVITDGPDILGRLNLGIQAFHSENVEVRAQYGLLLGDGYLSQSVTANLTWRF